MNSNLSAEPATAFPFRIRDKVLGGLLLGFTMSVIGVTSYFRLSSETNVLRESVMGCVNGQWNKRIAVHVGILTTGLVRAGSHFFKLAREPRAAFDSIR